MKRIVLAGLLGGIGMFAWSSFAHMVLPLGAVGVQSIPNEKEVLPPLIAAIGQNSGFYIYPAMDMQGDRGAAMQEYAKKLATSPSGILIYHPPGAEPMTAGQLVTEFLTEMIEAFLLVMLLVCARIPGVWGKAGFSVLAGLAAGIATNISYWNWYGFPGSYTAAYVSIQVVNFAVAGLIAAAVLGRGERRARKAAA